MVTSSLERTWRTARGVVGGSSCPAGPRLPAAWGKILSRWFSAAVSPTRSRPSCES